MSFSVETIKVPSIDAMRDYVATPPGEGEWCIASWDLDNTLLQARPMLGDENWYHFLMEQNTNRKINEDAHYDWTVKVRKVVKYEGCESAQKINEIWKAFRDAGWSENVLTSRGDRKEMQETTKQQLEDAQLKIPVEDIIFYPENTPVELFKDQRLKTWMEAQPQWKTCKSVRILYIDDSGKYCSHVARMPKLLEKEKDKATVTCLHYQNVPNPKLSEEQMKQLVVQLAAWKATGSIPYGPYTEEDLKKAQEQLKIKEITADAIYDAMKTTADAVGAPFKP